jgi:hypothetical protein
MLLTGVFDFDVFNDHLYWGAAEAGSTGKITTAEMGRIGRDGRWDLIVGEPREASAMASYTNFNCHREDASCVPLSSKGPGFGPDPQTPGVANYIWRFKPYGDLLYAGTADLTSLLQLDLPGAVPGADLGRSRNGTDWSLVLNDGFGNPLNIGVRTMASSPSGLFAGTANPFFPDATLPELEGGTAGAEVWLGVGGEE